MQKSLLSFCFLLIAIFSTQVNAGSAQGQGVVGVDFSAGGNNQQIAIFVITVSDPGSFKVVFTFANGCKFKCGTRPSTIPMTSLAWDYVSGYLGTGLTAPDFDILNHLKSDGITYEWHPTGTQTTETSYIMELRASWNAPAGVIAGFYYETITADVEMIY
jgi:hypothetical protein